MGNFFHHFRRSALLVLSVVFILTLFAWIRSVSQKEEVNLVRAEKKREIDASRLFPLDINKASKEDLMILEGIGPSKAEAIIVYRKTKGGFQNISQLKEVKGIGQATYEKIRDQVCVSGKVIHEK